MKKLISFLTPFFIMSVSQAQSSKADSNFHLYLLAGQSNMAGRGVPDSVSAQTDERILMLDSLNHWVPAKDPGHFDKPGMAGVGPAIAFAKELLSHSDPHTRIGLIPCAWGGSPIKVWEPGQSYLGHLPYDEAIARTKLAMQSGVLKGVLWHQGESDNDSVRAALYLAKLQTLIARFRTDFSNPRLPFIAGELGYFLKRHFINPALQQLPAAMPYTALVSAEGLTDKGDSLHFNSASARLLGKRYAEALVELLKKANK